MSQSGPDKLDLLSYDVVLAVCYCQGPARAIQLIGMACHELADSTEGEPEIAKNLCEIAENLERYAQTILEHMWQVPRKPGDGK